MNASPATRYVVPTSIDRVFNSTVATLTRAGISWRVHHAADDYGCNVLKYFTQLNPAPNCTRARCATATSKPCWTSCGAATSRRSSGWCRPAM